MRGGMKRGERGNGRGKRTGGYGKKRRRGVEKRECIEIGKGWEKKNSLEALVDANRVGAHARRATPRQSEKAHTSFSSNRRRSKILIVFCG